MEASISTHVVGYLPDMFHLAADTTRHPKGKSVSLDMKIVQQSVTIQDEFYGLYVIQLNGSLFVWIGDAPTMDNLALAHPPTSGNTRPAASTLFSQSRDEFSESLARLLATKYRQPVYVSMSLSERHADALVPLQRKLVEMIQIECIQ
jgi:hypothetical protein